MVGVYTGENSVHLDLHVTVDGEMTIDEADKLSVEIAEAIMAKHPEVKHVSIHFCPHEGRRRKIYKDGGLGCWGCGFIVKTLQFALFQYLLSWQHRFLENGVMWSVGL